ncbi:response regulator [Vallitalea pronyensis]|uniref:Stage 0 sporulation protein A homolog n=1 Tax=Vallitalea pronyensis TaxID=1348613 RepID=A0A8J8SF73_9FIRM|nr:response regulator [Vallitalea pronyensis]QUI20969.1 response regulator [Vallitalea pronyensis]
MLQLLIADDNSVIRKGIINLLNQYDMVFDAIYECANGKEALALLDQHAIDLVITDIQMPVMDGIDLIQEAHKKHPQAKFIVLTMYEDFNYAKDSMNYGAIAYLVKPIGGPVFYDTIHGVLSAIKQEKAIQKQHKEDALKLLFLSHQHNKKVMQKKLKAMDFKFYRKTFYIGVLIEVGMDRKDYTHEKDYAEVECCIHDLCESKEVDVFYFILNHEVVLFSSTHEGLLHICHRLSTSPDYFMSISQMCSKSIEMYTYYCQAREGLKYRYLFGTEGYVDSHDIRHLKSDGRVPLKRIGQLEQLIGTPNIHEIDEIIGDILLRETIIQHRIEYLEAVIQAVYAVLQKVAIQLPQSSDQDTRQLEKLESLYNFKDVKHYIKCLRAYISRVNQSLIMLKQLYKDKEIDAAIHFIQENYHKDITLAVVSNYVSLSYSYFSHAFKDMTGISFSEYLREVRVNRSVDYLGDTALKIGEIAVKVGFTTPKNYTRSFKAVMGISPVQYRQKLLMTKRVNQIDSIERVIQ